MMSFDSQLKFSGSSSKQGKWAEKETFPPAASRLFLHKREPGPSGFSSRGCENDGNVSVTTGRFRMSMYVISGDEQEFGSKAKAPTKLCSVATRARSHVQT
jgi:hypothetical protein